MRIGITGLIGSGKSTVSKFFAKNKYKHIDVDKLGWTVLEDKKKELIKVFGKVIIIKNKINRKKLNEIVFKDVKKLKKLNKITHPEIYKKVKKNMTKNCIIDAALLKEIKLDKLCDLIILVKTKKAHILERNKKIKNIKQIMKQQINYDKPDITVYNNGTKKELQETIKKLYSVVIGRA